MSGVVSLPSESILFSTFLACGILETPAGERIAAAGFGVVSVTQGRYDAQNSPETPPYQYVTSLNINRLSYVDAGIYDCTASYIADGTMLTESNSVELNLAGMYIG